MVWQALESRGRRQWQLARLGAALHAAGREEEARQRLRGALEMDPDDENAVHTPLLDALLAAGEYDEAHDLCFRYLDGGGALEMLAAPLLVFRVDGDTAESRELFDDVYAIVPPVVKDMVALVAGDENLDEEQEQEQRQEHVATAVLGARIVSLRRLVDDTPGAGPWLSEQLARHLAAEAQRRRAQRRRRLAHSKGKKGKRR